MPKKQSAEAITLPSPIAVHQNAVNHGFYEGADKDAKVFTCLALIHAEVAELTEEWRRERPNRIRLLEEAADIVLRVFDLCGYLDINVECATWTKHKRNLFRPYKHGKRA